jgi:hypothetical protein
MQMRRPFKKHDEFADIERDLRQARPEPRPDFIEELADRTRPERREWTAPRVRFGAAAGVTGAFAALVIALGGAGAPVTALKNIGGFANAKSKSDDNSARAQYQQKQTICHRPPGNPSKGQTLTLPPSAAQAHLRNHPFDHAGPC